MHELFRIICFEYKVCSLDYFLDSMQEYEVQTIIENLQYLDRNSWEQYRFLIYSNIQMNSKKRINPTDIMKFSWDRIEENNSITSQDIERLKKKSQHIYNTITQNGKE